MENTREWYREQAALWRQRVAKESGDRWQAVELLFARLREALPAQGECVKISAPTCVE